VAVQIGDHEGVGDEVASVGRVAVWEEPVVSEHDFGKNGNPISIQIGTAVEEFGAL
jgi:hypothetical protein